MVNVTSGGSERTALPIFERRVEVVEKAAVDRGHWKAGRRNEGMANSEEDALCAIVRQRCRDEENMLRSVVVDITRLYQFMSM